MDTMKIVKTRKEFNCAMCGRTLASGFKYLMTYNDNGSHVSRNYYGVDCGTALLQRMLKELNEK